MIRIGLIGYGYWGPNLARNFHNNPNTQLLSICDFSHDRLKAAAKIYPYIDFLDNVDDFFKDNRLDAVAIATPVSTHFSLAQRAIETGRHVWLEKPMVEKVEQAEKLIELATQKNKRLMLDHTFIYTGAVRKIKELVSQGEIGDLIYYDSTRVNLGLFQHDVDVIWDLAPHDISIMDYLMPFKKLAVSATGANFYGNGMVPKAVLTVFMEGNRVGHINVSWVSPVKIRQTLIGGTNKMILYDDNQPSEKIRVYDKGVDIITDKEELYKIKVQYRVGDMWAPKIENHEALSVATQHFVDCIENEKEPETGGLAGLEAVKILAASKKSLELQGAPVEI